MDVRDEDTSGSAGSAAPGRGGRGLLLAKAELFSDFHIWTPDMHRRAQRWLDNFRPDEQPLAVALLDAFLYFSDLHATQLLLAGFQNLSNIAITAVDGAARRRAWTDFCDTTLTTTVEGEDPNATDSGLESLRKLRYHGRLPEANAYLPVGALLEVVTRAEGGQAPTSVVFVDDFSGSGSQFIRTWTRPRVMPEGRTSFAEQAAERGFRAYFCPSLCTEYALAEIAKACPEVIVSPGNLLSERYNALHADSLVWPPDLRKEGQDMLRAVSARLGLDDESRGKFDWRGYHAQGLAIAVRDGIPDASLRIFRLERDDWFPLMPDR